MKNGFTIIEILIGIAITLILLAVVIIPFRRMSETQVLSKEILNVVGVINNARSMALSSRGGVSHGVHFATSTVTLFRGDAYSPSDPTNIAVTLHPQVSISNVSLTGGVSSTVFDKLNGNPTATGTLRVLLNASTTQYKTITITTTGIIEGVE